MPRTPVDDTLIDRVLKREGGYVDHPADKGGPTNRGITLKTLSDYWGHPATLEDIQQITEETARDIYYSVYIYKPGLKNITWVPLREFLFDAAVQHGPLNAVKMLQRALAVPADGVFGTQTQAALWGSDLKTVLFRVAAARLHCYGDILSHAPSQQVFAAGWFNRMAALMEDLLT